MAVRYVGFDSAWADHPHRPGSICALGPSFVPPRPAGFDAALALLRDAHGAADLTILAIDQPTVVPNAAGARPVDRVAAALMSWSGGGVQPAYRGKATLFGDGAPIWRFLAALGFRDDPEAAATASAGGFVMEVFPAMALLALDPAFLAVRGAGPRYNPARKTFRQEAWRAVGSAAAREARRLGYVQAAAWCDALDLENKPRKSLQDDLDALLCALVAARWRRERASCAMLGDLGTGYIVAPVSAPGRVRLATAAARTGVGLQ